MCTQWGILAVYISRNALQSRFTEHFFSKSRFTDTKKGQSQHHENKLAQPPPPPPDPLIETDTVTMSTSAGYWLLQDTL